MITGDLDLDRTVWDVDYRRQVIAFLAEQHADRTDKPAAERPSGAPSAPPTAEIIPFPRRPDAASGGMRRAAKS